jgi:hypothetical protein
VRSSQSQIPTSSTPKDPRTTPRRQNARVPPDEPSDPRGTRLPVIGDHANLCIAVLAGELTFHFQQSGDPESVAKGELARASSTRAIGLVDRKNRSMLDRFRAARLAGSRGRSSPFKSSRACTLRGRDRCTASGNANRSLAPRLTALRQIFLPPTRPLARIKRVPAARSVRSPINTSVTSATPALDSLGTRNPPDRIRARRRGRAANRCEKS